MIARLLFVFFVFLNFLNAANVLEKISLNKNVLELKFKSRLKEKEINYITLDNPKREVFDFENSELGSDIGSIDANGTVRIAQNRPDRVRVVVLCGTKGDVELSGNIYKIPLNLQTCQSDISSENKKEEKNFKTFTETEVKKNNFFKNDKTIEDDSFKNKVIVIDAGHGGKDPGAVCGRMQEKDVTLSVAKRLGRILAKKGFKVYLTRDDDRFITLEQRTKIADRKDANIFISLHCNAAPNDRAAMNMYGIETFFLQRSRDARSQAIAARENASVLQGTDTRSKQVILDAVLSGPKIVLSNKLAIDIQSNLIKNIPTRDGGVRSAPFWVLVGASRPSILVEMGYITHPQEGEMLFNDDHQNRLANGIANGIVRYLENQKEEMGF